MSTALGSRRVAVIGGGCTGLAAANRIRELDPNIHVTLFESSDRLGGVIRTERFQDYLVEHGADMFTTKQPWAIDLCNRLGMADELLNTNKEHARAFVVYRGRLCPVPEGFSLMTPGKAWPIIKSPLLSLGAKLRMAYEYFVPRRFSHDDESLADFATRRLGKQAYERLIQPLIGGIYTADPTKLSMQAAMPQFVEMEREHGGLLRSVLRTAGQQDPGHRAAGARYGLFVAPRDGMQSFMDKLIERLPPASIRLRTIVESLAQTDGLSWQVSPAGTNRPELFDAVILATPAYRTAELLSSLDTQAAEDLRGILYASTAIVVCGYVRKQLRHPLDGFGVVVPQIEQRMILAASFASVKFVGRAPSDRILIRVFVGGACQPELLQKTDQELEELVQVELRELLGASGRPELCKTVRWEQSMPQYHVGHLDRVTRIEQRIKAFPTLALAGNAYRGVGIPQCIHSGEQAAERIVQRLRAD